MPLTTPSLQCAMFFRGPNVHRMVLANHSSEYLALADM